MSRLIDWLVSLPELGTEGTLVRESFNVRLYVVPHVHFVQSNLVNVQT